MNLVDYGFTFLTISSLLFLVKANNRGWSGGGGGGNRWKHSGSGFNSRRQQNFRPNNFQNNHHNPQRIGIVYVGGVDNFNNPLYNGASTSDSDQNENANQHYFINDYKENKHFTPDSSSTSSPGVTFSHNPSSSNCAVPSLGDLSKFKLECIPPESKDYVSSKTQSLEDCTSLGGTLASGTSVILRCKHPFISEEGDMRVWVCQDGIWQGEFKALRCIQKPPPPPGLGFNHDYSQTNQYNHNSENKRPYSWQQENFWRPGEVQLPKTTSRTTTAAPDRVIDSLFPNVFDTNDNSQNDRDENISEGGISSSTDSEGVSDSDLVPPWFALLNEWTTSTTTTTTSTTAAPTTTTTTTTPKPKPYLPPKPSNSFNEWNNFKPSRDDDEKSKCPPLSHRTGVNLECLSKTPIPSDASSFIVSQSDCRTPQVKTTEATYTCQKYYEASAGLTLQYRKCKEDGTWTGGENGFSCALECGKSNPVGKIPLITNGEPTYKAQWPWHAGLFFLETRKEMYEYTCGGTLISRRGILTAGHCVTEFFSKSLRKLTNFRIDLGRYERVVDDEYVQTFSVDDIVLHPSYNPHTFDSDLAIIVLKGEVTIGFHVRPICYPQTQNSAFEELHLSDGSIGTVVGFGKNENGELSDTLQMARLRVVSQQECSESFSDTNFGTSLTKSTTFCAGLKNGTNVCSGDSGGGIYFPLTTAGLSRYYLQGLVSVGISSQDGSNKCDPTRFSVFTRVSPYADWILRMLSERDAL